MIHPYNIQYFWPHSKSSIKLKGELLTLDIDGKKYIFSMDQIISIDVFSKRKLAPLIIGAVVACLALITIIIKGASLNMIAIFLIGMLVLYFGLNQYWVLEIFTTTDQKSYWLSKNKYEYVPKKLIKILNYKSSKGFYPPSYIVASKRQMNEFINNSSNNKPLITPLKLYLVPPIINEEQQATPIDITAITQTITVVVNKEHWAEVKEKISPDALVNVVV